SGVTMQEHIAHGEGRGEKGKTGQEPRHDLAESRVATALGRSLSHHAVRGVWLMIVVVVVVVVVMGMEMWMLMATSFEEQAEERVQVQGSVWMEGRLYEAQYGEMATLAIDTGALLCLRVAVAIRVPELLGMGMGVQHDRSSGPGPAAAHGSGAVERRRCADPSLASIEGEKGEKRDKRVDEYPPAGA
ncbi:hypothetical protein V494_03596, partial [Pseudogymnoascus sp. VKM F-4513 (FW-928)]